MFAASKSGSVDAKDPQFNYVTMLLHGNGTNGAQNNTFVDSSTNNFTITRNGNTTQGTFTPYGSNWSNAFATSAGIQYPYTSALTSWWTQDFTIEMWVYNNTNAVSGTNSLCLQFAHGNYTAASTYWAFGTNASGQVDFYYYNGGGVRLTSTTSASLGTWNHIAMVYTHSSGNISLYLNGVSVASATKSGTPQNDASNTVNIGAVQSTYYNGYISNLRVLNGTALYSSTFTPSTTPLTAITNTQLLTCQSNRFVDNSTNNATPTRIGTPSVQRFSPFSPTTAYSTSVIGGSGYFDGSGDYLSLSQQTALSYGTGDFTIEAWVYPTSLIDFYAVLDTRGPPSPSGSLPYIFGLRNSSGAYKVELFLSDPVRYLASTTVPLNAWTHIAVSRSSGTLRIFVNGAVDRTDTGVTGSIDAYAATQWVGAVFGPLYDLGYITNLRVVKGSAVYTSAFTPPTAPLTAVTNTQLLLNFTNAGILDNAMMNDLETVGNAQISTSVKKYGTGSMYFDGTGDYLIAPPNTQSVLLGTGSFTVEFWLYPAASQPTTRTPIISFGDGFTTNVWDIQLNNTSPSYTNRIQLWAYNLNSGAVVAVSTGTISATTWTHVAVVRNGTGFTIYINGTADGTGTSSASMDGGSTTLQFQVAKNSTDYFNGYIDDLRITKGVARYTTTFTPPTAAFADKG